MCDFLHPGWIDPLYKPHFVCFDCRKHFKLRDERVEAYWRGRTGATTTAAHPHFNRCFFSFACSVVGLSRSSAAAPSSP